MGYSEHANELNKRHKIQRISRVAKQLVGASGSIVG
jgi:hypothetical protein